jgi:DNA-binding beta-propeller fold protein YncE
VRQPSRAHLSEVFHSAPSAVAVAGVLVWVAVWLVVPSAGMGQTRSWSGRGVSTGLSRVGSRSAGGVELRAPLSGLFSSIEPGAPPSVPVGANPSGLAVSKVTHTVYSVNQNDNTVSVIDAHACNAQHLAGCGHALATIKLGGGMMNGPVGATLARDGETLYVTSTGQNALAVIDASTCNATRTSGCAHGPVATVATGQVPVAVVEDPHTHTLYVANVFGNTVSVIDAARCNADQTAGCGNVAPTVAVGTGPSALALDRETHTLYVANVDDNTVSVLNTKLCNATQTAGCGQTPPVQAVGGAPSALGFSKRTSTVYVANGALNREGALVPNGNTVSVMDAAACNAEHPQGCSAVPPPAIPVGSQPGGYPQGLAVDQHTQNVYVANFNDDTLSVIDGKRCNAHHLSGCAQSAPTVQMGGGPPAVAVVRSVHTIYIADGVDGAVAVIDERTCTAEHLVGCRPAPAPAAPLAPNHNLTLAAVDVAEHTAYVEDNGVGFAGPNSLDLIDTSRCNAHDTAACNPQPPLPTVPIAGFAGDVVVDQSTNTVYVDGGGNDLEVIAGATCNARDTSCTKTALVPLGTNNGGGPIAIDLATHTVYVGGTADIAVVDALRCNAEDMSGCATQTPATIVVDPSPNALGVAPHTLYDAEFNIADPAAPSVVDVIDTRHCQAADTSGCASQPASRVHVGLSPGDTAVDLAHHTLYVPDSGNGETAGLLSMIDIAHCNGDDTSDCAGQTPATTRLPRSPQSATLDPFTDTLYVTDFNDASVSLIDTATCNAARHAGCGHVPRDVVVGSGPAYTGFDPADRTLYVPNLFDGTVSIIGTDDQSRAKRCRRASAPL